ncbi:MAG TPA: Hpt domain-containing protein [Rhizomicrobium sp.]|nr:Hpt domain-containing protein [Rhizomicrobium sp.]
MGPNSIDLEHLGRYTGGDKELNAEVLRLFDDQVTSMVTELNGLLANRDSKRWREVTHSIKGAARGVGAFSMGELAARAEPVDPANAPAAKDAIEKLAREAESIRAFIEAYLAA